jgi:carboxyl-terminal processing protease
MYHQDMIDDTGHNLPNHRARNRLETGYRYILTIPFKVSLLVGCMLLGSCGQQDRVQGHLGDQDNHPYMENPFFLGNDLPIQSQFDLVLGNGLEQIIDVYYQSPDLPRLMQQGLDSFKKIDPAFRAFATDNTLKLVYNNQEKAIFTLPSSDGSGWSKILIDAVHQARKISPLLAEIDDEKVLETVFVGITRNLDRFSRYVGRQDGDKDRTSREGGGNIGLALKTVDHQIMVEQFTAGDRGMDIASIPLKTGDILIKVNEKPLDGTSLETVRQQLQGPVGSIVTLAVNRQGAIIDNIVLVRERIIHNTVTAQRKDNIGFLAIERFNAATAINLQTAINAMMAKETPLQGLVIDLRGNPGGLLDQAVDIADMFLDRGNIITTHGRHHDSYQRFDAHPGSIAANLPMVVLVDGGSASAAEVVAAALQDNGRAVVVGSTSYGKGSVQTVTNLANDGELFVTWSEIMTPTGSSLNRRGVIPNICSAHLPQMIAEHDLGQHLAEEPRPTPIRWSAQDVDAEPLLEKMRQSCPPIKKHGEQDRDRDIAQALIMHRQWFDDYRLPTPSVTAGMQTTTSLIATAGR